MHVVGSRYAEKVEVVSSGVNSDDVPPAPLLTVSEVPVPVGVAYGFTTRAGGVSTGAQASLNLAVRAEARPDDVAINWARAVAGLDPRLSVGEVALMDQVHGATVVQVQRGAGPLATVGAADGAWTDAPGVVLAVRTADCVPVILMSTAGVGVAHAGWRGTVAGVVPATVRALCAGVGIAPDALVAVVGPHISGAAYEVGSEVVEGLRSAGLDPTDFLAEVSGARRPHVDLGRAVARQLTGAGVSRVFDVGRCTARDEGLYSHRVDGPDTGRQAGLVARLP